MSPMALGRMAEKLFSLLPRGPTVQANDLGHQQACLTEPMGLFYTSNAAVPFQSAGVRKQDFFFFCEARKQNFCTIPLKVSEKIDDLPQTRLLAMRHGSQSCIAEY
jgi:hypothetical protein